MLKTFKVEMIITVSDNDVNYWDWTTLFDLAPDESVEIQSIEQVFEQAE